MTSVRPISETELSRPAAWLVAGAGFAAALTAMIGPGLDHQAYEIAAILSIGALALITGHRWGLLVVVVADVILLGTIWPTVVAQTPPDQLSGVVAWAVMAGTLPGLIVFPRVLPGIVDLVLGDSALGDSALGDPALADAGLDRGASWAGESADAAARRGSPRLRAAALQVGRIATVAWLVGPAVSLALA